MYGNVVVAFGSDLLVPMDINAILKFKALKFYLYRPNGDILDLNA